MSREYVGSYLSEKFGLLHVTEKNGKLYLWPDPIPGKEELISSSDTTFYFEGESLEWEFFKDKEGKVIGLGLKGDRGNMGSKKD